MNPLVVLLLVAVPCALAGPIGESRDLDEATKARLMAELAASSDDRAAVWTPYGITERPAFHCTNINNLGQPVCCTFTSLYLLNCYSPVGLALPWVAPVGK